MRTFGLIGYPLTHSFSQKYFTQKFEELGITDAEYLNFPIPGIDQLPAIMAVHPGLCGFNITIPYKKQILEFLHSATDAVKEMGACNCVHMVNGQLRGYNTDVTGFRQSLEPFLQSHHTRALVLGSGGASAAVTYALEEMGIGYTVVSRTPDISQFSYAQINEHVMMEHTLLINTSPVGQYPDIRAFPEIPYHFITGRHHLFDLIYNPEETAFLQKGKAQGATVQNGYEMLVLQAEESWRIWNSA